jgi:hypothetical protein
MSKRLLFSFQDPAEEDPTVPCRHCGRFANQVNEKYRPHCIACYKSKLDGLHSPVCCNGSFIERFPEFAEC